MLSVPCNDQALNRSIICCCPLSMPAVSTGLRFISLIKSGGGEEKTSPNLLGKLCQDLTLCWEAPWFCHTRAAPHTPPALAIMCLESDPAFPTVMLVSAGDKWSFLLTCSLLCRVLFSSLLFKEEPVVLWHWGRAAVSTVFVIHWPKHLLWQRWDKTPLQGTQKRFFYQVHWKQGASCHLPWLFSSQPVQYQGAKAMTCICRTQKKSSHILT